MSARVGRGLERLENRRVTQGQVTALLRILDEDAFAAAARRTAAEMGAQRPVGDAVELLERLPD